jgi:hypothetical protein
MAVGRQTIDENSDTLVKIGNNTSKHVDMKFNARDACLEKVNIFESQIQKDNSLGARTPKRT